MIARYDLSARIVSFDFSSWLVMAAAKGATKIVFANLDRIRSKKWPRDIAIKRFESILWPMPALLGLETSISDTGGEEMPFSTDPSALVAWVKSGKTFPRYRSVLPAGTERYTVTLRKDWRLPGFNSNEVAWRRFAEQIGARVIEDYDVDQLPLHERFALYAGAVMNFGTVTGPTHLVTLSHHPAMIFRANHHAHGFSGVGIANGGNYPWALPGQCLIWEDDSFEVITRNYKERLCVTTNC